jgi:hypothetical protein
MLLSFTVFKEKILDGTKVQTIRKYTDKKWKVAQNAQKYQLYWGNPRNGGTLIKEVERASEPVLIEFERPEIDQSNEGICKTIRIKMYMTKDGKYYTVDDYERIVKDDGFASAREFRDWFYEHYGEEMFKTKFIVFRWNK